MSTTCMRVAAVREINCERLKAAVSAADVDLNQPIDTATAFHLLRDLGYSACRERLDYHLRSGKISPPLKVLGHFSWSIDSILDFADSLDATKDWLPHSRLDAWLRDQ